MAKQLATHVAEDFFKSILNRFPGHLTYSFAYGSGVFPQQDQKPGKMIDMVFVVDDPVAWHKENLSINPEDYSALGMFGPNLISYVQEKMASGIFYNPYVQVNDEVIKYGVMSTKAFREDLTLWNHFYIAGRLQKPVRNLHPPIPSLVPIIEKNRMRALRLSLIKLPSETTTLDLYVTISKLSYSGDFRMYVGEHPRKAENIVKPLLREFDRIYYPLLKTLKPQVELVDVGKIQNAIDPSTVFEHMMMLPIPIQCSLVRKVGRPPKYYCVEETMAYLAQTKNVQTLLNREISDIVFRSSIQQTIQGILSAGIIKSIRYGLEKIKKKIFN